MSTYTRRRYFGRFSSAEEFDDAVAAVMAEAEGVLRTSEVGARLGPVTYNFSPRCGHEDCTRPEHQPAPLTVEHHTSDVVRPVLVRLERQGMVERVAEPGAPPNRALQWRWIAPQDRPRRRVERNTAVERALAAQADLERRLGLGP